MHTREKNVIQWTVGAALLGLGAYAIYKALTRHSENGSKKDVLLPVAPQKLDNSGVIPVAEPSPAGGAVHFERKHPNRSADHSHQKYSGEHSIRGGNGPGERNQIGGRSSGKVPRHK